MRSTTVAESLEDNNAGGADVTDVEIVYPGPGGHRHPVAAAGREVRGRTSASPPPSPTPPWCPPCDTFYLRPLSRCTAHRLPPTPAPDRPLVPALPGDLEGVGRPHRTPRAKGVVDTRRRHSRRRTRATMSTCFRKEPSGIQTTTSSWTVSTPGGTKDEFGKLTYTNTQPAQVGGHRLHRQFAAAHESSRRAYRRTLSVIDLDQGTDVFNGAMTFDSGLMNFTTCAQPGVVLPWPLQPARRCRRRRRHRRRAAHHDGDRGTRTS